MSDFKERAAEFLASDEGQAELANALQSQTTYPINHNLENVSLPVKDISKNIAISESVSSKYANMDDVVKIKGALAALGYYNPSSEIGMTPYFDNELTTAIKEFQKDYEFPITGTIKPNGSEMVMLNGMFENPILASSLAYIKDGGTHNYMDKYERTQAIIDGRKLRFKINDNNWTITAAPHEIPELGVYNVKSNESLIDSFSKKHNVDPDMVKAIVYMEGANGHKGGLDYVADFVGKYPNSPFAKILKKVGGSKVRASESVRPMNIQNQWGRGFIGENYDPYNKSQNIEAGVKLIKRISESIENPTPEKIGSMWNGIMVDEVNDVGARVGRYYKEKPWKFPYKISDVARFGYELAGWGKNYTQRELRNWLQKRVYSIPLIGKEIHKSTKEFNEFLGLE